MNNAKLVSLIKTESVIGDGTQKNPTRIVVQYWDLKGMLLFTFDPYFEEIRSVASSEIKS